jgi:ribosomal protein L21E
MYLASESIKKYEIEYTPFIHNYMAHTFFCGSTLTIIVANNVCYMLEMLYGCIHI